MEDGVSLQSKDIVNMGATGNPNSGRLVVLQERKNNIQEALNKKNQELRTLCLQEADLTGVIPSEMPLEPGETPPSIRRRVGTSYTLDLFKNSNNKDDSISELEIQLQLKSNMADAALELAQKHNLSKTVRRRHKSEYQHHKRDQIALQEKVQQMKEAQAVQQNTLPEQSNHRKKPRPPEQDEGISLRSNSFGKAEMRQNLRANRHTLQQDTATDYYLHNYSMSNSEICGDEPSLRCPDYSAAFYRLSLNGYKSYMDRRESVTSYHPSTYTLQKMYQHQRTPSFTQSNIQQHSALLQQNSLRRSPLQQHSPVMQHSSGNQPPPLCLHKLSQHSPVLQSTQLNSHLSHSQYYIESKNYPSVLQSPYLKNYNLNSNGTVMYKQSSPMHFPSNMYPSSTLPVQSTIKQSSDHNYRTLANPHQLQPHQQYEQNVMSAGLGGCWKQKENGEMVWCNSSTLEPHWTKDKRFGSLDRRKNRRLHKRVSPNVENKSATLGPVHSYQDSSRPPSIKSSQPLIRHTQDNRQLVRTQSLGSVGAQTGESVWPSDDNSSCDSENRSYLELNSQSLRKAKQKEWLETSLDGPVSPTQSLYRSPSSAASVIAPEEKYVSHPTSPVKMKPPLEIPAESNPSNRLPETNIELFNNNVPKNCTVVQAGQCKPYHEETKPFEMSDFYKYSTKFKNTQKKDDNTVHHSKVELNANQIGFGEDPSFQAHKFSPTKSISSRTSEGTNYSNANSDLTKFVKTPDQFSPGWYPNREQQVDNNNATLV